MEHRCCLTALGTYTPEQIITNTNLCTLVDTSEEWITSRTGIYCRHKIADTETASDMGVIAARRALTQAEIDISAITHIIVATCTPDKLCPSSASFIANKLGATHCMAFDINAACSGYLYGLSLSQGLLAAMPEATILLICTEAMSRCIDWTDRATCVLFGDGAGACILTACTEHPLAVLRDVQCGGDSSQHKLITIGGGTEQTDAFEKSCVRNSFLQMQGREVFKHAVRRMTEAAQNIVKRNRLTIEDIDIFVPHQANIRIIEAVGTRLAIPSEKTFTNVADYGNTSAASIPLALGDALASGFIHPGQRVLCSTFGAGLTWGAALLEF